MDEKRITKKLISVFDNIIGGLAAFGGVILVFCMLVVTAEITMRYLLNISQAWLIQIIEYCLLFMTFLGVAWVMRREGHVKMDLLLNQFRTGPRSIIITITSFLSAVTFLVITWYGTKVTWDLYIRGYFDYKVLEVPKAYIMFIIPVGSLVLFIELMRRTWKHLKIWKTSKNQNNTHNSNSQTQSER